jgi:hypothetical protein
MLTPYSPLDFIEALERERREAIRKDANRVGLLRRLTLALIASSRVVRTRRPRVVPRPA